MANYKNYFIIKNQKALDTLSSYQDLYRKYVKAVRDRKDEAEAATRSSMLRLADDVDKYLDDCGIDTILLYGSVAMGRNPVSWTQVFPKIVSDQLSIRGDGSTIGQLDDYLTRAISRYENNRRRAIFNTINPFQWIGAALSYLFVYPLQYIFGVTGRQRQTAVWQIIGIIINSIPYLAALVTILEYFGITNIGVIN